MAGVTTGVVVVRGVVVLERDGRELDRWPLQSEGDDVDLACVDVLARQHLAAKQLGCTIRVEQLCPRVLELVELVGLDEVLG